MKIAEEWIKDIEFQMLENPGDDDWIVKVKQIQLDAWKQGMSDAANWVSIKRFCRISEIINKIMVECDNHKNI